MFTTQDPTSKSAVIKPPMESESFQSFEVELQQYRGPLDLLLYLVRRSEVDVDEIPISQITDQYLKYLDVIEQIDINLVGDFLEIASLLVEVKLRSILPRTEIDDEEALGEDPREDLVQRLLLYKEFKDVALLLEEQSREWQQRYPRLANDLPPRTTDMAEQPIQDVELWDLVSSFGRVLKTSLQSQETSIVLDETPLHIHMQRIHSRLVKEGQLRFLQLFEPGMHKSAMVGIFLAILELVRHHNVVTEQVGDHSDIRILPGEKFDSNSNIKEQDDF